MKKLVLLICIIFINLFFIGCNQFIDYSNEDIKELVVLKDDDLKDLADLQNEKFRSIVNDYENYIVDEIYFENSKIVGFSNNTNQGVLVYEKDIDGNYILNQTNTVDMNQNSLGVSHYRIIYENYNDAKNAKYGYLIISNGKNVSRVEITINDNNKTTTKYVYVTVKGNREATITSRDSIKISVGEKLTKDRFKKLINLNGCLII